MISIGFQAPKIVASVMNCKDQSDFASQTSILKNQKFTWNPNTKYWEKSALLYNDNLEDILKCVAKDVYFPAPIKQLIKEFPSKLPSELIQDQEILNIDYSKLCKINPKTDSHFCPVKGKAPYENYQDEDIRRALRQNRFLFNWSMGCGKSFATAIIYEYLKVYKNVDKMILLTTRIGTYNLQSELSKFCLHVDRDDILVFNSPKSYKKYSRRIFDNEEVCNKKILVFSYDSWKLMATAYGDKARGRTLNIPLDNFYGVGKDKLICLDECQQLSNPKSERSRSLFKYMKFFKYRYLFSATPADKNEKLYSVCMLLDPKLVRYMKYNEWINYYNDVGTWFSKYAINPKKWHQEDLDALNQDLAKYSAKRDAKDVLELPPARTETFTIDMSDKQKELYKLLTNDIVNNAIKKNPSLDGASVDVIHEAFSTVCSFCENPNILGTNTSQLVSDHIKEKCAKYNYSSDYAKLDVIDAILEDEIDEQEVPNRGILWYTHPKTKDVVVERYAKYKPIIIAAELSEEERDAALAEFKSNPEHKILIASQNILATSVTLIECTFAIYLETSFSFETYLQSTGRIYRIGQDKHVRFYHIWLNESTDMFHVNAIETKRSLVDTLFSAKEKLVLSLAQMRDLFSGKAV